MVVAVVVVVVVVVVVQVVPFTLLRDTATETYLNCRRYGSKHKVQKLHESCILTIVVTLATTAKEDGGRGRGDTRTKVTKNGRTNKQTKQKPNFVIGRIY